MSLSARRAWIEIPGFGVEIDGVSYVALRKESVDRNLYYGDDLTFSDGVALRKESVDRNIQTLIPVMAHLTVALRKESVDRNTRRMPLTRFFRGSLSARRAWIEILAWHCISEEVSCRSPQGERG